MVAKSPGQVTATTVPEAGFTVFPGRLRSLRIELPVTTFDPKPILDLNPQDPVLHRFVSDCRGRFGGNGGRAR